MDRGFFNLEKILRIIYVLVVFTDGETDGRFKKNHFYGIREPKTQISVETSKSIFRIII